jgi:chemotaxis regulatin CheY-phosphate phosphatase CheZ
MKRLDLDDIKIKVSEVKALFVLGQKIIPVLEDVFQFVYEIQPLFDEINTSIQETTSKVPKAADKIINISNATEMATSEILDYVDEIFKAIENLTQIYKENIEKQKIVYKEIVAQIKKLKQDPQYTEQADSMILSLQKLYRHSIGKKIVDLWIKEFEKLNILANKILMALQFQDITSQQLQAANHLISQVQNKLGQLMNKLGQVTPDELTMIEVDEQTFNENAEYVHSENRQKMIDEIEASFSEGEGGLSQEEIDRLAQEALNDNTPEKDAGENDE